MFVNASHTKCRKNRYLKKEKISNTTFILFRNLIAQKRNNSLDINSFDWWRRKKYELKLVISSLPSIMDTFGQPKIVTNREKYYFSLPKMKNIVRFNSCMARKNFSLAFHKKLKKIAEKFARNAKFFRNILLKNGFLRNQNLSCVEFSDKLSQKKTRSSALFSSVKKVRNLCEKNVWEQNSAKSRKIQS